MFLVPGSSIQEAAEMVSGAFAGALTGTLYRIGNA
jgi:hypothetical protein